jgi:5'-methylthioadenosine phosphorylase
LAEPVLGVIGGSGLYNMPGLTDVEILEMNTPFGATSSPVTIGTLRGVDVAFIARHGHAHTYLPSEVPYRANIYALKVLGVRRVLSVSAVGSLKEELAPLDVAVPDQIYDRTKTRPSTFFGNGFVAHVGFAHPFCSSFSAVAFDAAKTSGANVHWGGTLITIEGPMFSTIAESETYRKLGFSLIGMTAVPEAKLAREAELCYATLAMVTDYDVWHETHETVTSEMVAETVRRNVDVSRGIIAEVGSRLHRIGPCDCENALASGLLTGFEHVPEETLKVLEPIIGKYYRREGGAEPRPMPSDSGPGSIEHVLTPQERGDSSE